MNGLPYYKAYPRDFIDGTVGMPFEVKAAYRILIDLIYLHGGALPDNAQYIAGQLGCSVRKWNQLRELVIATGKIIVNAGVISNLRADKELESLRSLQDKQRENASRPRKNKDLAQPRLSHTESDTESDTDIPPLSPQGGSAQLDLGDDPKPTKAKRKAQFPADWRPSADLVAYAESQGIPSFRVTALAEACVDYHRSKGNTFLDHDAAFRTWVRNEAKRRPSPPSQHKPYPQRREGMDDEGRPVWMGAITREAVEMMRKAKAERDSGGVH